MTSSVHEFVAKHRAMDRDAAFKLLVEEDAVKAAIARSPDLEARLAHDFQSAWAVEHPQAVEVIEDLSDFADIPDLEEIALPATRGEPAAPAPARAPVAQESMRFLCPSCGRRALTPLVVDGVARVACPGCRWATANVLTLIHVKETGALEYVFGAGWRRAAYPAAGLGLLAAAFFALRWLRL